MARTDPGRDRARRPQLALERGTARRAPLTELAHRRPAAKSTRGDSRPSSSWGSPATPSSRQGSTARSNGCNAPTTALGRAYTPTPSPSCTASIPPPAGSRPRTTTPTSMSHPTHCATPSKRTGPSTTRSSPTRTPPSDADNPLPRSAVRKATGDPLQSRPTLSRRLSRQCLGHIKPFTTTSNRVRAD